MVRRIYAATGDFGHRLTEGLEIIDAGLIDQNITIRQKQDALPVAGFPQAPDDHKLPVPLAITSSTRFCPMDIASRILLTAWH